MLKRLSELRKKRNWSMQETADRLGIAKSTYAGYESGYRMPSIQALADIADLYETTVDYILNREVEKLPKFELTELLASDEHVLILDHSPLTVEELRDFIAFTRVKRELKKEL
ncbi:helix-turn-helix domain-containing protein [Halalkalibacter kiskunsagensis]|uniref:Helix-turn-helix domain-containing protein n=1 Tax=Halalkalibacter kiskunsagensis TaxID=1548599 RepID=A0ABV6KDB6_9BACI